MKKKIFIISLLLFVCFLVTGNDAYAVTVYNETDFRNALNQRQSSITIANSINFGSAITINYNVTIDAGSDDNAMRCVNKVSNFITVSSNCTLTLKGIVVDVRSYQNSAGMNCIRIPSGAKMNFQGSLIDGGTGNTGLLIENGGAVAVTRGDFVYSKYGVRVQGNGTLSHSNSGSMSFWNNSTGLLYESTATCTMPNSDFHNNTVGMQVSKGTVNFNGTKIYSNSTGIYVTGGTVNMAGGSVYSNSSMGLNVSSGTMNLKGGNVYSNGSGTYVYGGTMNHTGGTIYSNTNHGAVVRNGTYNLAGGTIKNNGSQGVVLDNGYTGTFKMTSGTISGNTSNAIHTSFAGDKCIIHGGTVSGWVYLALADNYVTTNTSYPTLSVKPASYAFKRKLVKTDSNANANSEIGKVTMAASGSWYKYVDGQYIVVWTGGNVIVKCVDLGNNAVLSSETKNGTIGTNVTLTDPSVTGYALVSRPSTTTYTYAQADQTATYGFRKISNLVINYIDANTNEVLVTQTVQLKEGDSYTATMRDIPGYQNTLKPTSETITMGRTDTELVYAYKKISDGVDVKYVDQVTGAEIADAEHKDGLEKDAYTTTAKTIDGYQLVVTPTNANGNMAVDLIIVTYEYRKNSNVIVKFIDENYNTEIADQVSTKYKEGDTYTTTSKDISGYQLTGQSDNTSGTVVRTDIEVTYKYKKISEGVDVKYVDQANGQELATDHIDGLEKDGYTTAAKDIAGYELVKTPDNAKGEMTVDLTTVTYEYRKNSNVIVKFVDENHNTEIADQVSTKYKEGDTYTTSQKDITGYQLTGKSDNTSGTVARTDIEVIYKYKKISEGVDVKYIDQVTGDVLEDEHIDGLEKDGYTTTAKDIAGYELVKTPDNKDGEMVVSLTTVTYEYRKNSNVTARYIDENYGNKIVEDVVSKYKEGDTYTTEEKQLDGYQLIGKSDNTSGTVVRTDVEVTYKYKKISEGVDIKYIDQVTGDELASEHLDGLEKDGYTTEAKEIEGYELVKTPDNKNGEMVVDLTTVTYEYRKNSFVIVRYMDQNKGTDLVNPITTKYKEGDPYTTAQKDIFGYELIGTTNNTSGTVERTNIEVIYNYKKTSDGVYISYIDQVTGDELVETIHIDGLEQDPYTSEAKEIEGYELVVTPANKDGVLTVGRVDVVYEYRKNSYVTVKYIDENYGNKIVEDVVTKYKEGDLYETEEKQLGGYQLTSKTDNTTGTMVRDDIAVEYRYKKISQGVDIKHIDQVTGEELSSEHLDGLEKDSYTTSSKTIDGYELVKTPDNKNGEMVVDLTTVTYEYRKNSNVIVKYIDENYGTNIIEDVVTKYKEGDAYTTEEKTFDGYQLTDKTDNLSGTVVRDDIVVIYEYKKISEGVDIKYLDQATGLSIADTVHFGGLEKDEYTTTPKDIEDYQLVFTSDNANGELALDLITVVYEYRMLSDVTAKFIDENYGTEITDSIVETYKEGDPYSTKAKNFDGYQLTSTTENISGIVAREDIVVEYRYKKISEGVDTRFIDQVTGAEIATPVNQSGLEKDGYTTTPKEIAGYELVKTPDNKDGEMAVELITVTYEYRLVSTVTTKYIDVNSRTEIVTAVENNYKEGDTYTTEEKTFDGYQLVGKSDNTSGTMERENIEVVYEYKKVSEGIEVVFIDQVTGNPIAASVIKTGLENQEYTTEAKFVEGYELVTIPANASGRMTVGKITVKYEYRILSEIVAKYVDVNYNTKITEEVKQTLKEGDLYTTEEKTFDRYKLVNNPQNKSGIMVREDIEVVYEYKKISDGVDVKYIDQVTGEEIADTTHQDGLEKDNYTTEPKEINGYELVKTPTNKNGEMTVELTTVTYEYRLVSRVITKHIDANTGKEIVEAIEDEYKEGDTYTTLPKDLVGYVITKTPDNTTGTIGRETIEVIYEYKKISDGLVVKYIDEITGDVMETETYSGNEEDLIQLEEKSYEGYILTKRPAVSEIKLTVEPQEVRFYYKKLININIIAIDGITGEEIYTKVQSGVEGEKYETKPIILPGYEISKTPENASGTYKRDDVNVIYEYKRISEGVIVTYIDKDTREILDTENISGFVGEEYETEKKIYEKYDYSEVIGNPKGKLEIDQIEVTYLYTKKTGIVEIVYADEEGNELLKEELTGRVDDEYSIEIKDITNYRIKEVVGETEGQYTIEKQIVKFVMEKLRGKVIVNLLDQNGNLIGQFEEEDFVGEMFEIELPEKEGYYIDGENKVTVEYIDGEIVINVNYIKIEEPPATGDINIIVYLITTLSSMVIIGKILLKKTKN